MPMMLRMPFSMEFILEHDDIYQKIYWNLLLSDRWILAFQENEKGNLELFVDDIIMSDFPIQQIFPPQPHL